MGQSSSSSSSSCEDGSCLTKDGARGAQYRAKWLKKAHEGTARDGYRFQVGYAPTAQASCRECKQKIAKGALRIGRSTNNPWDAEGGASDYTQYFHLHHGFDAFLRSKCTSKVPATLSDISGVGSLTQADKKRVKSHLERFVARRKKQTSGFTPHV
jgi:hypothetical protein